MTVFSTALGICGFSTLQEAADHFDVGISTVKHWAAGRRPVPGGVWTELARLYDQIVEVSEHALDTFDRDDITPEAVQAIAEHEHGSALPAPALSAVAAMFILTRMLDDE